MPRTRDDLIRETLEELSALDATRVPEPEDAAKVGDRIDTTIADLAIRNVVYIADADEIDDSVFNALVGYLAEICAPKFGRVRDKAALADAEAQLRTIQRVGKGTGGTLRVDPALRPRRCLRF